MECAADDEARNCEACNGVQNAKMFEFGNFSTNRNCLLASPFGPHETKKQALHPCDFSEIHECNSYCRVLNQRAIRNDQESVVDWNRAWSDDFRDG